MSEKDNTPPSGDSGPNADGDLCENPTLRDNSIDFFQQIFKVKGDPELFYFFPAGELLRLLSKKKVIGIKVHPALVDSKDGKKIEITMVLKPVKYNDKDCKKYLSHFQTSDLEKEGGDWEGAEVPGGTASCCPTPGIPKVKPDRNDKIRRWIANLQKLLPKKQ